MRIPVIGQKTSLTYYNGTFVRVMCVVFPQNIIFTMKTALLALLLVFALAQDDTVLYPADPIFVPIDSPLLTAGNAYQNGNLPSVAIQNSDRARSCGPDQKWDPQAGSCVAKCEEQLMCIAIKTWDPVKCSCECNHQRHDCERGYRWNEDICQCEQNYLRSSP